VGLGNPGPEYAATRHNAGFRLADSVARRWALPAFRRDGAARVTAGRYEGHDVRIIKPLTYMNRSGAALAPLRAAPGFDPAQDQLVLVADVALPVGRFRLRGAGSAGGHNGLRSIEGALRRQDYARLRIGVGLMPPDWDDLADFVLADFDQDESAVLDDLLEPMALAVDTWLTEGIESAMNQHNR
jgi:PTH1 family peptidyl-tRNA hydrolase